MEAELQGLERPAGEHELAVQHEAVFRDISQAARDLGKVPLERLLVSGLQVNPLAATVGEAAKAIVLRLVLPSASRGQFVDCLCLHRRQVEGKRSGRKTHRIQPLGPQISITHLHVGLQGDRSKENGLLQFPLPRLRSVHPTLNKAPRAPRSDPR